jgi:hypothetical protein
MPGFMPGIHAFFSANFEVETWMAGTSPAMTLFCVIDLARSAFALRTATDIRRSQRYINPARHVRAFGVGIGLGR